MAIVVVDLSRGFNKGLDWGGGSSVGILANRYNQIMDEVITREGDVMRYH